MPVPPEWPAGEWTPTQASDQWQLGALCFAALTGELPPPVNIPPLTLIRPDVPQVVARLVERALAPRPESRFPSITALLRAVDKGVGARTFFVLGNDEPRAPTAVQTAEAQLRWATGDDYEIINALGGGTFGSVWRVRDLTLGREVALKMLHPHIARDVNAVQRFHREARLAAQLAHPAIVPIYDWDSRGEVSWYTMELAEGGSLADLIARSGARPLVEAAPQVEQLLDALAAAHGVGIIHRDIKPENILIGRYSRWRLTDFGIANATGEEVGGTTGTPAFAAPEQLLGEPQGPAADSYAIAGIVYFALTGELPFGADDTKSILARQLTTLPPLATLDDPIAEWMRRGLASEPDSRFRDAAEMQSAWRQAVDDALGGESRRKWWRWLRR
jgi:serine/threonine-protein kinase